MLAVSNERGLNFECVIIYIVFVYWLLNRRRYYVVMANGVMLIWPRPGCTFTNVIISAVQPVTMMRRYHDGGRSSHSGILRAITDIKCTSNHTTTIFSLLPCAFGRMLLCIVRLVLAVDGGSGGGCGADKWYNRRSSFSSF